MAIGIDWLEANRNNSYPFMDSDLLITGDTTEHLAKNFFVDAYLTYAALLASNDVNDSWYIKQLNLSTVAVTLKNVYSAQEIVVTPTQDTSTGNYRTIKWVNTTYDLVLVVMLRWADHPLYGSTSTLVFDRPALFSPRVLDRQPKRVTKVKTPGNVTVATTDQAFGLEEGFNVGLAVNPDTAFTRALNLKRSKVRPQAKQIVITASPGLGAGKADTGGCANTTDEIVRINKVETTRGRFVLAGDSCYRVTTPVDNSNVPVDNALQLGNDCEACCSCDEHVSILNGIRALKDEGLSTKGLLNSVISIYNEINAIWQERLACIGDGCQAQAFVYSFTGWLVSVQVWVGNAANCANTGASVRVEFGTGFNPMYVPGSGMLYNEQDNYQQLNPNQISSRVFLMSDNSGTSAGSYKLFVMAVRMHPSDARVDGATVPITVTVTGCGDTSHTIVSSAQLKSNTVKP